MKKVKKKIVQRKSMKISWNLILRFSRSKKAVISLNPIIYTYQLIIDSDSDIILNEEDAENVSSSGSSVDDGDRKDIALPPTNKPFKSSDSDICFIEEQDSFETKVKKIFIENQQKNNEQVKNTMNFGFIPQNTKVFKEFEYMGLFYLISKRVLKNIFINYH